MIYFAYDGSINGDWVAQYAITLASRQPDRRLRVVHVEHGEVSATQLQQKLGRIQTDCTLADVLLRVTTCPMRGSIFETLIKQVPLDADTLLICGTRVRRGMRGFLSGTVSEKLLKYHRFNVMAVRVVQPGLLGAPHDFLVPLIGRPHGLRAGMPFMRLFAPEAWHVHLLRVIPVSQFSLRRSTTKHLRRLHREGWEYVRRIESELIEHTALHAQSFDASVRVSHDWPKEIVIYASRHKSHLIYLEAQEHNLTERFFYANPIEKALRDAPCDVAIYCGIS